MTAVNAPLPFNSLYLGNMGLYYGTPLSPAKDLWSPSLKNFQNREKRKSPETTQLFPAGNCPFVTLWCLYHIIVRTFQVALCAL